MNPEEFMRLTEDMNYKTIKDEKKLAKIFSEKKPVLTYILMAINVAIYALTIIYGDSLYNMFANHGGMVASGQIYRLVTSMFLHGDIFHIGFNMYALYVLGPQVERYYGSLRFGIIYFLGGLLGSIFSCVFMNDMTISFGGSGAIFALAGSVAYFTYHYRATLQGFLRSSIIPTLILNLCLGFMIPGIDFMCHIGGLIGGILISMAIGIATYGAAVHGTTIDMTVNYLNPIPRASLVQVVCKSIKIGGFIRRAEAKIYVEDQLVATSVGNYTGAKMAGDQLIKL